MNNVRKSSSETSTIRTLARVAVASRLLRLPATTKKVTNVSVQNGRR